MPEWSNGTDSKSVESARVPRVQIPISPPNSTLKAPFYGAFAFLRVGNFDPTHNLTHTLVNGFSSTLYRRPILQNHAAKMWQRQAGGVVDLRDPARREKRL